MGWIFFIFWAWKVFSWNSLILDQESSIFQNIRVPFSRNIRNTFFWENTRIFFRVSFLLCFFFRDWGVPFWNSNFFFLEKLFFRKYKKIVSGKKMKLRLKGAPGGRIYRYLLWKFEKAPNRYLNNFVSDHFKKLSLCENFKLDPRTEDYLFKLSKKCQGHKSSRSWSNFRKLFNR